MKVVMFNGSVRKEGVTGAALNLVMEELKKEGIEVEIVWMGMDKIQGCVGCYKCMMNKDNKCAVSTDKANEYIAKMMEADGIILGSPTYFADTSARMKALIERAGLVGVANDHAYKHKVGAAVVAVRRAGAAHVFSSINYFFLINQIHVIASSYWNLGIAPNPMAPKDFENDAEGIGTFKTLGENMAYVLKKLNA